MHGTSNICSAQVTTNYPFPFEMADVSYGYIGYILKLWVMNLGSCLYFSYNVGYIIVRGPHFPNPLNKAQLPKKVIGAQWLI